MLRKMQGLSDEQAGAVVEGMGGKRQTEALSISLDRPGRNLGIERVDELNIERRTGLA